MWGQHCSGCSATKRPKTTSQSRRNLTERKRYRIVGWATATPRWATWSWLWMPTPGPTRWAAKKCTRKKEIGWKLSSTPRKASSPSSLVDNGHCILIDIDRQLVSHITDSATRGANVSSAHLKNRFLLPFAIWKRFQNNSSPWVSHWWLISSKFVRKSVRLYSDYCQIDVLLSEVLDHWITLHKSYVGLRKISATHT